MATNYAAPYISQTFACGVCHSPVAHARTMGGDEVYECQNARCQKCVSIGAVEALALVEDVAIEQSPIDVELNQMGMRRASEREAGWYVTAGGRKVWATEAR